ncbi:MAG: deoxyribodipyrimidine photo-lyase, partial [Actinomycetota bacterium]
MDVSIVVLTRDLRLRDNPALAAASSESDTVIPLFVFDPAIVESGYASPNRVHFLLDALTDLRRSLREIGGDLVLRHGDTVTEALTLAREHGAEAIHIATDVSRFAARREHRLARACADERLAYVAHPGPTVIEPGAVSPTSGDHYKVFTPYWRAWKDTPWRAVASTPRSLALPDGLPGDVGAVPDGADLVDGDPSPDLAEGGESIARSLLNGWTRSTLGRYDDIHDDLAGDETSRLSPYLHFGCVSALEVATRLRDRAGGAEYVRQLCWRDFHHQVTAAFPSMATDEYRTRGDDWREEGDDLDAWKEGRTGYPIVDAGMRQLRQEGWMHNRARMIT